ncbi:hypothetical protein H3U10_19765 [Clostridioides difficile]|nr:hypothetical protein [Clostridioides difficile]
MLTYRSTSYKNRKDYKCSGKDKSELNREACLQQPGDSTPQAILDGSDKTNFNKIAPTRKIFSSGVGEKRAKLSTTHCTQQVIPE